MRDTSYKLLGMAVWHGGKLFLRRKYGSTYLPKPLLAGMAAAVVAGGVVAVAAAKRGNSEG
jgi:hypothetical protein